MSLKHDYGLVLCSKRIREIEWLWGMFGHTIIGITKPVMGNGLLFLCTFYVTGLQ